MFSLRKIATPAFAALLMLALPAWSALAQEPAAPATVKDQATKEPVKDQTAKEPVKAQPAQELSAKEPSKVEPAKDDAAKEPVKDEAKAPAKEQPKTSPSDAMIRVNGTTITRLERDRAVKVLLAQSQVPQPVAPELMKQAEDAALEQLVSAELLYQEASKVEPANLDKLIAEKVAQNRAKFASDAEFETALKGVEMTQKDLHEFARKDIVINNFIEKRFADNVTVSEADAKKFYDDNLGKYFTKPESARASHILIGVEQSASAEEHKKAKEKAEALLKRVKAGEDFATLAKSDSTCPSSSQGGDLGSFGRGQMVPPFEKAAFALKPGEVSDVVETQFGYHIIKLTEKQEAGTEKYENVKAKIVEFLKRERTQKGIVELVEKLKTTARMERLPQ
jgi:peptidyl-prolyl cis-trans isomerase C